MENFDVYWPPLLVLALTVAWLIYKSISHSARQHRHRAEQR